MELSVLKKPELVVALDIGTTYSGYAWQWRRDFENNRSNVEFNTNWGNGALQLHKTNTCVMLDKNGKVDTIGYLAEDRFMKICDQVEGTPDDYLLFKEFKTLLYNQDFEESWLAEDYYGRHKPFLEVMSQFICGLKDHFINLLKDHNVTITGCAEEKQSRREGGDGAVEQNVHTVDMKNILWVVTVPIIWSEKAKKFMRKAAEKTGISSKNLLIALESESAALYSMGLSGDQKEQVNNLGAVGDRFVVADLGGGTVDISAVEVLPMGQLKEICAGDGALFGGHNINDLFFQVCRDVFGEQAWCEIFSKAAKVDLLELEQDFEKKTVHIGSTRETDEFIKLKLPQELSKSLRDGSVSLEATLNAGQIRTSDVFDQENGVFKFKLHYVWHLLFGETIKQTVSQVEKTLANAQGVRTLVLVGLFAESKIVIEKFNAMINQKYPSVRVVVPTSPFRAVLHGAVLYGHDPMIFFRRISRLTIGIRCRTPFIEGKHDRTKLWKRTDDGKLFCNDIFRLHIKKGESVVLNKLLEKQTYFPITPRQTKCSLLVYACTGDEVPKYTTDPGCKHLMTVEVETPDTTGGTSRKITTSFVYGGTELSVIATDENTGKEFNTRYTMSCE